MKTLLIAWLAALAWFALPLSAAPPQGESVQFSLQLDESGRLNLGDAFDAICDQLHVEAPEFMQLDWSIDVDSMLGRLQLSVFDRLFDGAIATSAQDDRVVVNVDREKLKASLLETGATIEGWLHDVSDRARRRSTRAYGITLVVDDDSRTAVKDSSVMPPHVVVLVHGLDDPGFMWRDLIPALQETGVQVARFEYPNDGPIADAADLLAAELMALRKQGVERVDIVAHSMGGLVARDVLTRAAYYAGDGAGSDRLPAVDHLIMLGTPNHGSRMARLHGLADLREHFYRAWHGDGAWIPAVGDDGDGEAGVDLLPNSDFLRRLNERPLASHTRHSIIAGRCIDVDKQKVASFVEHAGKLAQSESAPEWMREWFADGHEDTAAELLGSAFDGLGDGCVAIDSTRLEGVEDFTVVQGNHLSMIVNVMGNHGTPPAIPLILERLGQSADAPHTDAPAAPADHH